jgi:hypothetical protein
LATITTTTTLTTTTTTLATTTATLAISAISTIAILIVTTTTPCRHPVTASVQQAVPNVPADENPPVNRWFDARVVVPVCD